MSTVSRAGLEDRVAALLAERTDANRRFFAGESERIALLCRQLAECFLAGGRLLAVGGTPQQWSDAHHVAVEFVHLAKLARLRVEGLAEVLWCFTL